MAPSVLAVNSLPTSIFNLGGSRLVGLSDALREVAGPLLRIIHDLCQPAVEYSTLGV